jgi:hypothetical protein
VYRFNQGGRSLAIEFEEQFVMPYLYARLNCMYFILLTTHSYFRWIVLVALLAAIFTAYHGWLKKRKFSAVDNRIRNIAATAANIQFLLGLSLYFISPIVRYFYRDFQNAFHMREIRFFGMEHSVMMLIAIGLISTGSAKAKQKTTDREKFKTMAVWFTIALLVILSSIPWPFTGLVSRPYFRGF